MFKSFSGELPLKYRLSIWLKISILHHRTRVMKFSSKSFLRRLGLLTILFSSGALVYGQEEKNKDFKIEKRTVLEKFDSELVISLEERIKLKEVRAATIQSRLLIMDSLNISARQRRRLLKELFESPFSDEWNKVIANLEFEEGNQ